MTQPPPLKETARQLEIRSAPKPATRINRKLLLAGAGLGALGLLPRVAQSAPGHDRGHPSLDR